MVGCVNDPPSSAGGNADAAISLGSQMIVSVEEAGRILGSDACAAARRGEIPVLRFRPPTGSTGRTVPANTWTRAEAAIRGSNCTNSGANGEKVMATTAEGRE
jgi:hypothetical protein